MTISDAFGRFSRWCADALGSPISFAANCLLFAVWVLLGPVFAYSDTWQLIAVTATAVLTYLAVFVIQNTQNRDAKAIHLKLNELISSLEGARNRFVHLDDLTDEQLQKLKEEFEALQQRAIATPKEATRAIEGEPRPPS